MTTNELKKGARVILENGWFAEIYDNKKGGTRLAKVYGFATEIGSVYSHDIERYQIEGEPETGVQLLLAIDAPTGFPGMYAEIQHTEKQIKLKATVSALDNGYF